MVVYSDMHVHQNREGKKKFVMFEFCQLKNEENTINYNNSSETNRHTGIRVHRLSGSVVKMMKNNKAKIKNRKSVLSV